MSVKFAKKVKVEKVGSNMAEAVMLSAIESLECWLLKKGGIIEENKEKLYSLIVGMSDLGEEKKEMLHILLLGNETQRNEGKMYNLLDLNMEKMCSLVVGMADFWEDYQGKIYHFLFAVARTHSYNYDFVFLLGNEKLQSLLVEIADMWGDDEGELNKEELHSLLFQMLKRDNYSKKKMVCRMSGEVARLWKDKQPKLNKEKLYTCLANKLDLYDDSSTARYHLFGMLLATMLAYHSSGWHAANRKGVEGAKREFGEILDLIRDKKLGEESSLRYFISDVVDMARDARSLIQLQDSDPFALFLELSVLLQNNKYETHYKWFGAKFNSIMLGLREIKVSMLGFGVERLQNVREMEGGENVVRLEEDVNSLLLYSYNTIVIKGMVGSGKTTLARQVYNHTTITQQFERRAWVCLSTMFSRKEMLVSLTQQVVDSNELASLGIIERADYKSLKQVLRQQLLGRKYFIVLDDASPYTTHLRYVMKALPKGSGSSLLTRCEGCRLLITTHDVYLDGFGVISHRMKSMDDDKSWRLLLKTLSIEGSKEEFPKPLVKKARQILRKKCDGLPLAIKEVGAKKRLSGSEWEEVIESVDLSETLRALESSYHNWDQELKSRFLHLAFFKEGATIRTKRLLHIWKVMGVVLKADEGSLLDLQRESIIDMDRIGNGKTCRIHAVFHMLSIRKAEDELNFEILNKDGNNRSSHQPHHRAIYCSREKLMNYSSNQDKHLVSLFLYGGGYFNARPSYWNYFEQLKILDMEDFGLKILPDMIGMLTELGYLGLRNNYIQELPHSLSCLKKLVVLDIALNFMVEVEDIIWEMESLRHLYMSDISCRKPLRIDKLKNLETWTYVSAHNWMYEASSLEMMTSLAKLGIQEVDGNTDLSKLFASLIWSRVSFLILRGFRFKSMPSLDEIGLLHNLHELKLDGLITRLPSAKNFPPYIMRLSLVNSCLHEDPMPILEKLSNLTYLKLHNAYTGQQMVFSYNGFPKLEFLVIEELWHLKNVQIEEGAMWWLRHLEIYSCPNLETFPEDYYPRFGDQIFKMKSTKINATKIRESIFVS